MPKPNQKNKRDKSKKYAPIDVKPVSNELKQQTSQDIITRKDNEQPFRKKILIVGEGPTEAAYFEGLYSEKDIRNKYRFDVKVLPDPYEPRGYKGSSVKGLLYTAMQEQKKTKYDEVWIVSDNDEENGYKLDYMSLGRIKELVPEHIYEKLKAFQINEMVVRGKEKEKNEHLRIRYFLCRTDYEIFLTENILDTENLPYLDIIVTNTTKKRDFTDLFDGNLNTFFYDRDGVFMAKNSIGEVKFHEKYFDAALLKKIKIAYSCISFEHWILLHFEKNNHSFYNSREIIKHFDVKKYFDKEFSKGWYLYEQLKLEKPSQLVKHFFKQAHQAIRNNVWLNAMMQSEINKGKTFYEVNPYSDVFWLTSLLLNTPIIDIDKPISYRDLGNISVSKNNQIISISFVFGRKAPELKQNIDVLFSVVDVDNVSISMNRSISCDEPIRKGDTVKMEITIPYSHNAPFFLYFKEKDNNGIERTLIWLF
jgi:RloB-like protein